VLFFLYLVASSKNRWALMVFKKILLSDLGYFNSSPPLTWIVSQAHSSPARTLL
jgi:hypothetical protein